MRIYNSQTRRKEEFVPLEPGKVRMYACGPTVYDYFHIGNGRTFVVFDALSRFLRYRSYEVTLVQNFTDIDDKMIRRAQQEGTTVAELGDRFIAAYREDSALLGIHPATIAPRATEHISEMIALIEALIGKGYAYAAADGVYFDTQAYPEYGALSGRDLEQMEAGARIEVDEAKRHPMDFALWKAQKPGEPAWPSPWGEGRPGWHIECSAMAMRYLGETIDIHTGAEDLLFPHHENELAQSCGATGKPLARYWMHTAFLNFENEKMSKSLGNFFTVRDIAKRISPAVLRYMLISAHYRSPLNFSEELTEAATNAYERLTTARQSFAFLSQNGAEDVPPAQEEWIAHLPEVRAAFIAALDDDFNTAEAMGVIFEFVREANTALVPNGSRAAADAALALLTECCGVLGILAETDDAAPPEVQALCDARQAARKDRDFARADALRDELKALGWVIEDTPQGPKLKKAT